MIAALFVQKDGCYYGLPDVDPWDEERDARLYGGPHPVVAHPPCARWSMMSGLVQHVYGYKRGDDGGCFASALESVRRFGGVLEHPASSFAFTAHGLPAPDPRGGWQGSLCGGWVCQVAQRNYGHPARKRTWLYAHGIDLPQLVWGDGPEPEAWVSWCAQDDYADRPRLSKEARKATPLEFRDVLLDMARSAEVPA